jgi:hypothetical protein
VNCRPASAVSMHRTRVRAAGARPGKGHQGREQVDGNAEATAQSSNSRELDSGAAAAGCCARLSQSRKPRRQVPSRPAIPGRGRSWSIARALPYLFEKDTGTKSTCYGGCPAIWRPVVTKGSPVAGTGAKRRCWERRSEPTARHRSPVPGTRSTTTPAIPSRARRRPRIWVEQVFGPPGQLNPEGMLPAISDTSHRSGKVMASHVPLAVPVATLPASCRAQPRIRCSRRWRRRVWCRCCCSRRPWRGTCGRRVRCWRRGCRRRRCSGCR